MWFIFSYCKINMIVALGRGIDILAFLIVNGWMGGQVQLFGSTVSSAFSLHEESNTRIWNAATTFGKTMKPTQNNRKLTLKTKVLIYQACFYSTLLHGCEIWTSHPRHEGKKKSVFSSLPSQNNENQVAKQKQLWGPVAC